MDIVRNYDLFAQVCDQFIFGFPYCWEKLVSKSFTKKASKTTVDNSADAANFLSKSLDKLPGSFIRYFSAPPIESSGNLKTKHIFRDMLLHAYSTDSLNNQRSDFASPSEKTRKKTLTFPGELGTSSPTSCKNVACEQQDKGKQLLTSPGKNHSFKKSRRGKNSPSLSFTTRTLSLRNRSIDILVQDVCDNNT